MKRVERVIEYGLRNGEFEAIGIPALIDFFNEYLAIWQREKKRMNDYSGRVDDNPHHHLNKSVAIYTYARNEMLKKLHRFLETAEPNSHLYRLPRDLIPEITEYVSGVKYQNYKGGAKSYRKRTMRQKYGKRKTKRSRP